MNVLLVVVDSLRADMPWAGYPRDIAPWMTGFEKQAVDYARAYSLASVTARSVGPLMASRYASEMDRTGDFFTAYYPKNRFLAERLHDAGRRTLGAFSHAYFFGGSGLRQGFDDWRVLPGTFMGNDRPDNITSERLTALAKRMIVHSVGTYPQQPFFLYVHYQDPHHPYLAHPDGPDYGKRPRDLYDEEVHYTDHWVGQLVDWVVSHPWGRNTAVIVTADHGECFGEHGQVRHGYELWEPLVHVPLLVRVPGTAHRRVDVPRSAIDLAPTVLELMGVPRDAGLRGESLLPEIRGGDAPPRPVLIDLPRDTLEDRRRAVVDGDLKLIAFGDDERWQLYDVVHDPGEHTNLAGRDRRRLRRMKRLYEQLSAGIPVSEVHGKEPHLKNAPLGRRW